MNKSTFVDIVGPSTLRSGTWKESYPLVHLVIHKQSLVRAMKPRKLANLPRPLWQPSGKNLESTDMGRYTSRRENCVSPASGLEIPARHGSKKYTYFVTAEVVVKAFLRPHPILKDTCTGLIIWWWQQ